MGLPITQHDRDKFAKFKLVLKIALSVGARLSITTMSASPSATMHIEAHTLEKFLKEEL